MRKTKLVGTLGPSSSEENMVEDMISAGMDVARINLSHGNQEVHKNSIMNLRNASRSASKYIALLMDTRGPEVRIKSFAESPVQLNQGQDFFLTTQDMVGNSEKVSVTYKHITKDVSPGCTILIDDGNISLEVMETTSDTLRCRVNNGGILESYKGINIPGTYLDLPILSDQDKQDIIFGLEWGIDFIAVSFVRNKEDILTVRTLLEENNEDEAKILAKIENQQGVDNFHSILEVSDGVLIARGDLGVEIPAEEVPLVQKSIIKYCNQAGKPVITATQMLESMINNPRPTRAEASDVANAIFDGSDAIMLSGETAVGKYPVEATETMNRIAERTEKNIQYGEILEYYYTAREKTVTDAISYATCYTAQELGASAIVTATQSGYTARMVSKYRPQAPIIAVTPINKVAQSLTLSWGVYPVISSPIKSTDDMFKVVLESALAANLINMGDLVIITAGLPVGISGTTNFLRIETIGEVIARGTGVGKEAVIGKARIVNKTEDLYLIKEGDIVITAFTDRGYVPFLHKTQGIVSEEGGLTSHSAIMAVELGIPAVVGVKNATSLVSDGELITLDCLRGQLYRGKATVL